MKKKILSLMLAMVMMLNLSVTALAATNPTTDASGNVTYADEESITIGKNFVLDETADSETVSLPSTWSFSFNIEASGNAVQYAAEGTETPNFDPSTFTITNENETYELTLPEVSIGNDADGAVYFTSVGVYTYTITEVKPTNAIAGVTYEESTYTMYVTVVMNDDGSYSRVIAIYRDDEDDKQDAENTDNSDFDITNTYNAHSLTIHKDVEGAYGDKTDTFSFTVTFTSPTELTWLNEIGYNTSRVEHDDNTYVYTFELTDDDEITFTNIPDGVGYTVEENLTNAQNDYDTEMSSNSETDNDKTDGKGTFDGADITETVTNTRCGDVDTGVSLDSLPYILMLIVVAAGVVVMISRRRLDNRF